MINNINDWIKNELYPALFDVIDAAFPEHDFRRFNYGWRSKTYLDGRPHKRRFDKTVVNKKAMGRILEQGGDNLSLIDYVMQRDSVEFIDAVKILAGVVGLQVPGHNSNFVIIPESNKKLHFKQPETDYLDSKLISKYARDFKENNFVQSLDLVFKFSKEDIQMAILDNCIGTSKHWEGSTIFWQIDNLNKVRHGKVMLFDSNTGKRVKKPYAHITSVGKILGLEDFNLKQCLFGLHQINEKETRSIAVVESEKTKIIMGMVKPQYLWLATASKGGFNNEMLKPIKDYNIIAFPDKGEYYSWLETALELKNKGYKISVDPWVENNTNYERGTDLADVYLDEIKNGVSASQTEVPKETPVEETNIYSTTEHQVNKWGERNPNLWLLIDTFDLTDENGSEIRIEK